MNQTTSPPDFSNIYNINNNTSIIIDQGITQKLLEKYKYKTCNNKKKTKARIKDKRNAA